MTKVCLKKKHHSSQSRKRRVRRSAAKRSYWNSAWNVLLRLVVFPIYVLYLFWRTVLFDRPRETAHAVKYHASLVYEKSKKYYRKAKAKKLKRGEDAPLQDAPVEVDEGVLIDEEEILDDDKGRCRQGVHTVGHQIRKLIHDFWRGLVKSLQLKRAFQIKMKWAIRATYYLWNDSEKVIFRIKGLPYEISDKITKFVKDAIKEEKEEESSPEINVGTADQSDFPPPISLATINQAVGRIWPDDYEDYPSQAKYSRLPITRGRTQSRQTFSERIEGTVPARRFFAPATNEELIDEYFSTYDAIQPHDPYRRGLHSRTMRERILSGTDAGDSMDVNPVSRQDRTGVSIIEDETEDNELNDGYDNETQYED